METITIKVNTKSSKVKKLFSMIMDIAKEGDIEIEKSKKVKEKKLNPEFMKELEKSYKSKGVKIKTEDLWK